MIHELDLKLEGLEGPQVSEGHEEHPFSASDFSKDIAIIKVRHNRDFCVQTCSFKKSENCTGRGAGDMVRVALKKASFSIRTASTGEPGDSRVFERMWTESFRRETDFGCTTVL